MTKCEKFWVNPSNFVTLYIEESLINQPIKTWQNRSTPLQNYPIYSIFQLAARLSFTLFQLVYLSSWQVNVVTVPSYREICTEKLDHKIKITSSNQMSKWDKPTLLPTHSHNISAFLLNILLIYLIGCLKPASWHRSASQQDIPVGRWWLICWRAGRMITSYCLSGTKLTYRIGNRICIAMVDSWQK